MLGHESLYVRLGGVTTLYHLARDHLTLYGNQVAGLLDNFSALKHDPRTDSDPYTVRWESVWGSYVGPVDGGQAFIFLGDIRERLVEKLGLRDLDRVPPIWRLRTWDSS